MPIALTIDAMSPPMSTVTSTLAMARAAAARGVDADPVLAAHGLSMEVLLNPDNEIPCAVELAVWDELRQRTGDPALQLVAPVELPGGTYHVLEYLMGASPTIGAGLKCFARFLGIVARQVSLTAHEDARRCGLTAASPAGAAVPPLYVDYTFGAIVGRTRSQQRPALLVAAVDLRQPPPSDPGPYERFFRCAVRFGARSDSVWFDRAEWDIPLDTHDPTLAQVLETHARIRLERAVGPASGVTNDVRRAIIATLPSGAPIDAVAHALHMSVRTLQRRLDDAGTSYRAALDVVRGELAREYLADRRVSISEVALLLGFADQSSFHRAFERWTGTTPGRWRADGGA